jgi:hypothetical protein
MLHFVGFEGDEYWSAVKIWGAPQYIHRWNDKRLWTEVAEGDIVVFARSKESTICKYSFNDSEVL